MEVFLQIYNPKATTICIHDWLCLDAFLIACIFNLQIGKTAMAVAVLYPCG